jgi:hypothetical protein
MKKAMNSLATIISLMGLSSCYDYVNISSQNDYEVYQQKQNVYILDLLTNNDSIIGFDEYTPGLFEQGEVVGYQHILMQDLKPDSAVLNGKKSKESYAIKNGARYRLKIQDKTNVIMCVAQDKIHIPYSDIKQMHLKELNQRKATLVTMGIAGGGALLTFSIAAAIFLLAYL